MDIAAQKMVDGLNALIDKLNANPGYWQEETQTVDSGTFYGNAEAIADKAYAGVCTELEKLGVKYDSGTPNLIFFNDEKAKKTYVIEVALRECEEYEGDGHTTNDERRAIKATNDALAFWQDELNKITNESQDGDSNNRHIVSNAPTDGTSGSHAHGVSRLYRRATADKPERGSEKMPRLQRGIVFTISEPDCGAKPTGYAAEIDGRGFSELRDNIIAGLGTGWGVDEGVAAAIAEDHDALRQLQSDGYCWFREKWLVEIIEIGE